MDCSHNWGDEDFDWNALYDAEKIINFWCRKIGRVGIHSKEKYGTLRASVYFWRGSLHELLYPGYVSSQFPQWLWKFDIFYITKYMPKWIINLFFKYQKLIYKFAYYRAMKKYPHIKDEICVFADCPEFIIGGKEIHDKYWITYPKE